MKRKIEDIISRYYVEYKGKNYFLNVNEDTSKFLNLSRVQLKENPETDKYLISVIPTFEKEEDALKLILEGLYFYSNSEYKLDEIGVFSYNLKTGEGSITKGLTEELILNEAIIESRYYVDFYRYVSSILKDNETVLKFAKSYCYRNFGDFTYYRENNLSVRLVKLLEFITVNKIEMEKLLSSNNEVILTDMLREKNSSLEKGKKLSQVINIPKFVFSFMKENNLEHQRKIFAEIANKYDGNTVRIVLDTLDKFDNYNSKENNKYKERFKRNRSNLFPNILEILNQGYKINPLLNYTLKQRMYYSDKNFDFPFDEISLLKDYLNICKEGNLKPTKYPQNLRKSHDIALKNKKCLSISKEQKELYQEAVKKYYQDEIVIDNFTFIAPETIEDLVMEGSELHHCIATYYKNVIDGISKIYFMRITSSKNKSYVTLELNKKNELVEFKGDCDKEPTDKETLKAIRTFEKSFISKKTKVEEE